MPPKKQPKKPPPQSKPPAPAEPVPPPPPSELGALQGIHDTLKLFDMQARVRMIAWLTSKLTWVPKAQEPQK